MIWTKHFMKVTRFQFYLLVWCQAAETLTDQQTDLGQNVTINCDLDVNEFSWLLLKLPHPPVMILRPFSSAPFYYHNRFKQKYSVQSKHHLLINNVTLDVLGVYYCMSTDTTDRRFSNGTRLHISETTTERPNYTVMKCIEQNPASCLIFTIISGLMNAVLIIVLIGLLKVFVLSSKTNQDNLQQPQDSNQAEYAEVNVPTSCEKLQSNHNSIYALVQLPCNWLLITTHFIQFLIVFDIYHWLYNLCRCLINFKS